MSQKDAKSITFTLVSQFGTSFEIEFLKVYRRIHHVKFSAFRGNQLEHNGSQGANGAG